MEPGTVMGHPPKLPHHRVAEQIVLGNCFHARTTDPLSGLEPEQFYSPSHRLIAAEMLAMGDKGEPISTLALHERLDGRVHLSDLFDLEDGVPEFAENDLVYYKRRIIETARLREGAKVAATLSRAYLSEDAHQIRDAHEKLAAMHQGIAGRQQITQFELVDSSDFLKRTSTDERPHLIQGLIPAESHTMWQGRPKAGKSHSLLQLAFDAASGLPVFKRFEVKEPVRVGYIELEEPEPETKKRLAGMIRAHGGKGPEAGRLWFFSREDLYRLRLLPHELLTTKVEAFADAVKTAGVELLILIALRKFMAPGQSLNDPEVAERLNTGLCTLRQLARVAIAAGHHDRKSPAATVEAQGFGSTMLGAEVDGVFDLRRRGDSSREVCFEGRYRVEEEHFCLELSTQGDGEVIVHAPWHHEDNALKAELRRQVDDKGKSVNSAAKELGIPKTTAYNWMEQ